MNGIPPLSALRRTIHSLASNVREARFFRDRLSVGLVIAALIINGLNIIWLVFHVRPVEGEVPVHFSSLALFDRLGPWYFPFFIALFGLGVTLLNDLFAYHSFGRSRLASFFLLITSVVVAVFCFIISTAFGALR